MKWSGPLPSCKPQSKQLFVKSKFVSLVITQSQKWSYCKVAEREKLTYYKIEVFEWNLSR